jgi:hypothetical protein
MTAPSGAVEAAHVRRPAGAAVGLLFQPYQPPEPEHRPSAAAVVAERAAMVCTAVAAQLLGEVGACASLFTPDVRCLTPRCAVHTLDALAELCDSGEDAFTHTTVTFRTLDVAGESACAEWRLDARFTGPLLVDDDVLVEPTHEPVHLDGATFLEFRDGRIASIRHYFDDGQLVGQVRPRPRYLG